MAPPVLAPLSAPTLFHAPVAPAASAASSIWSTSNNVRGVEWDGTPVPISWIEVFESPPKNAPKNVLLVTYTGKQQWKVDFDGKTILTMDCKEDKVTACLAASKIVPLLNQRKATIALHIPDSKATAKKMKKPRDQTTIEIFEIVADLLKQQVQADNLLEMPKETRRRHRHLRKLLASSDIYLFDNPDYTGESHYENGQVGDCFGLSGVTVGSVKTDYQLQFFSDYQCKGDSLGIETGDESNLVALFGKTINPLSLKVLSLPTVEVDESHPRLYPNTDDQPNEVYLFDNPDYTGDMHHLEGAPGDCFGLSGSTVGSAKTLYRLQFFSSEGCQGDLLGDETGDQSDLPQDFGKMIQPLSVRLLAA